MFIKTSCLFRLLSPFRSINFHFSFVLYFTYIFNRIHRKKNEATNDDRIRRDTILQQPLLITFIQCYLLGAKLCLILDSNVHIFTKQYAYIKVNWQLSDLACFATPLILAATERYRLREKITHTHSICSNNNNNMLRLGHFYLQCISWLIFFLLLCNCCLRWCRPQIELIASAAVALALAIWLFLLPLCYRLSVCLPACLTPIKSMNDCSQIERNQTRKRARVHK